VWHLHNRNTGYSSVEETNKYIFMIFIGREAEKHHVIWSDSYIDYLTALA
jgi:hypothetical protein